MAIFHLNAKTIGRSQGRSATGAAAYRAGVRITDTRTGLVFDYTRKRGVDGAEIHTPDGIEIDRAALWNTVEQVEKRSDAQVAREIEVALPRELTPDQMRAVVRSFVSEQFVAAGMVADIAFHHLNGQNPHAHILLTLREWQGGGFGLKRRDWNERALCERWRERWAHHANTALDAAGHAVRIDHRSLIEQAAHAEHAGMHADAIALDRVPTIHERGSPAAAAHNAAVRETNADRLAVWAAIEAAARDEGRLMTPSHDSAPRSKAVRLAADDLAFEQAMRNRTDHTASRWAYHDDAAKQAAAWLAAKAGEDGRRLRAHDRAHEALAAARERRDRWREEHARPPLWRFWERPRWRRAKIEAQAPVEHAKRVAVKAERRAAPEALTAWRQAYAGHQAEHAAAIAARRACALLPSEEAQAEAARVDAARRATTATAAHRPAPRVRSASPLTAAPTRPRPGRR